MTEIEEQVRDARMVRIETKLEDLIRAIGTESEDEYGKKIGTGLTGRVMRMELRFGVHGIYTQRAIAIGMAGMVFLSAIWWALEPKVRAWLQ